MAISSVNMYICLAIPAALSWLAATTYYQYSRLKHIPGPRTAGLSIWWFLRVTLRGRTHLELHEVCEKYGSIARVGPRDLVTSDPKLALHMLSVRSQYTRSAWYNGLQFEPGKNNIVSVRDDIIHNNIRSKMAGGYSGKEVEHLEEKIDNSVKNLIRLLESYIANNKPFDIARKIQYFALDVISDLAFGEPFGDLASDSDIHNIVSDFETYLPYLIVSTVMSWMIPVMGLPVFRPLMPSKHDVLGVGRLMGIAKTVAAERYGPKKRVQRDMVGSFVARGLSQQQTESEIAAQIVAGSDTTATGIRSTLLNIITNPRVLSKLREEINAAKLSWPIAKDSEIRQMPYLQASIREGLRLFPPVSGFMSKEVPIDGDCWNGITFPAGTRIGFSMVGILRQRHVWGEDANEFRPERWFDATPDMEATIGLVFGGGKWGCLGKNVAQIEMNKVIVEILRRFDVTLVDATRPWKCFNYGVFLQSEFWVRAYRREDVPGT